MDSEPSERYYPTAEAAEAEAQFYYEQAVNPSGELIDRLAAGEAADLCATETVARTIHVASHILYSIKLRPDQERRHSDRGKRGEIDLADARSAIGHGWHWGIRHAAKA